MEVGCIQRDQGVAAATLLPANEGPPDLLLSKVPVEVWLQILESVIDVPYVLDTNLPKEGCYWWARDRYHERSTYIRGEIQRETLKLVCKGWKTFADQNKYRWLCFTEQAVKIGQDTDHLKDALASALTVRSDADTTSWNTVALRRLTIAIASPESKELFCRTINYLSFKLAILFIDCALHHGSVVFEHLITHSQAMPCMRCLMLTWVDFRGDPLRQISRAFPKLTGLTFVHGTLPHNPDDVLQLPQLESLYIGKMKLSGMRPGTWSTPDLLRLLLPINDDESPEVAFGFVKALGANLVLLRMDTDLQHVRVGDDLWRYCPQLSEIVVRLSAMEFLVPVPSGHPLRWIVNKDPESARVKTSLHRTFENNLMALGSGVEAIIMTGLHWTQSANSDLAGDIYIRIIARDLEVKGVRLEDKEGSILDDGLAAQAPRISSESTTQGVGATISSVS